MYEQLDQTQLLEQVKQIIKSKNWYALTENNVFTWEKSVELMAEMLSKEIKHIEPQQIKDIIADSFDEEALSKVDHEYFVDCLLKIDPNLIMWSEGDLDWQQLKANKTGLLNRSGLKTEFINKDKTIKLKDLILSLTNGSVEKVCVLIIDDKVKNLNCATNLQEKMVNNNVVIRTFQLSLQNIEANPNACLAFMALIPEKKIRIIADMDGVLVDTNRILAEIVAQKLAKILGN